MIARLYDDALLRTVLGIDGGIEVSQDTRRWSVHRSGPEEASALVLLISGLGMHRIEWCGELLLFLHAAGFQTLTVDNHDAGMSTLRGIGEPYTLRDIASDLLGLLDMLGISRAHVIGISMGGMIAQHLALVAPERVLTMTSLASTTGRRGVGRPAEQAKWIFRTPIPESRKGYLDYAVKHHSSITSAEDRDVVRASWVAEHVWLRGVNPPGVLRQLNAIAADGDRTELLRDISVPVLVLHGDADPMIDLSGGLETAAAIPGSRLVVVPGMGHIVTCQNANAVAASVIEHLSS